MITPSASEIEKHHLGSLNLIHVPGKIEDFSEWLVREIPKRPSGWDLAIARRPELRNIHRSLTDKQKRALNSITLVSADTPATEVLERVKAIGLKASLSSAWRGPTRLHLIHVHVST